MKVLAVIPARGGSKGIPRKNMRLMNGEPLIEYAIRNALESAAIDDVAVSSDSQEILEFASQFGGVLCLDRDSKLAEDAVTLDPVIYDAVLRAEEINGADYDVVVTLQPTSPLLSVETLDNALLSFEGSDKDSLISVTNTPHLSWHQDESGSIVPSYEKRLNRQQLPPNYLEAGAFLICKRSCMSPESRLGDAVGVFEIPSKEAVDIDAVEDWLVCESVLMRKTIAYRVDGYKEIGLGHVFRGLTLAYALLGHDVVFVCNPSHREGIDVLRSANMLVEEVADDEAFFAWLEEKRPDVLVNDRLDTTVDYIQRAKRFASRVVSFEDLGPGARVADAVVNAIYEGASPHSNVFTGKRFVCLRDEFLVSRPVEFADEAKRVLVTFGGSDPLNLTKRVYDIALKRADNGLSLSFNFILGPGYQGQGVVSVPEMDVIVSQGVARMSDHIRKADIAICSQGRTTFELASMGVPSIVLAQNKREQLHTFAQMDNGFINLGLGSEVSDEDIASTLEWLVNARSVRREMHRLMLENDLRSGVDRVKDIIIGR